MLVHSHSDDVRGLKDLPFFASLCLKLPTPPTWLFSVSFHRQLDFYVHSDTTTVKIKLPRIVNQQGRHKNLILTKLQLLGKKNRFMIQSQNKLLMLRFFDFELKTGEVLACC